MSVTVYIPSDTTAAALGANAVVRAVMTAAQRRGVEVRLVRNGSRGLVWLEPLLEIEHDGKRVAFGPVRAREVEALFDSAMRPNAEHALYLGDIEQHDWLRRQQRLTFARCGVTDPLSLDDYLAHGGGRGHLRALQMDAAAIVREVTESGLRGRGGAGFPTGIKWNTVLNAPGAVKHIVCNADEGDSGTFADRMLMEGDPFLLLEGMIVAGLATGATRGWVYVRSEYPMAFGQMTKAVDVLRNAGWLGQHFDIELRLGAGAYICGEETALLESLEGKRGQVRAKPPLPALHGLFGQPTVVNNVLSFAAVPTILDKGAAFYRDFGIGRSRGTQPFQLAGNVKHGGLVETAMGLSIRDLVQGFGGGTANGRPLRAVQVGGPLGAYFPNALLDTPLEYESMASAGGMLGHGGVVVFDDGVDLAAQARFAMEFCAIESCGKCTPCRIGSTRGVEVIDRIIAMRDASSPSPLRGEGRGEGEATSASVSGVTLTGSLRSPPQRQTQFVRDPIKGEGSIELLNDLCATMLDGSLCALGGLTPYPVRSALRHFPEDFQRPVPALAAE